MIEVQITNKRPERAAYLFIYVNYLIQLVQAFIPVVGIVGVIP